MTFEKAKEIVNDAFGVYYSEYKGCEDYNENEVNEAHNMAIEALKYQEEAKKNKAWREHWAERGY